MFFEIEDYYLNDKVINKGYEAVKSRILELNDVAIETEIIPRKKSINEIAEEEGLEIVLEILARNINIEIQTKEISEYCQVIIKREENKLLIIINERKGV